MKKATLAVMAAAGLVLGAASGAQAQILTPTFQAPQLSNELGVYVSDGPFIEGAYRRNFGGYGLGFRGGFADVGDADGLSLGIEFINPLDVAGAAPVAIAFTAAGQVLLGDLEGFGAQAGLDLGYTFVTPGLNITPYIHPRIALVDCGEDCESDVEPLADLGINLDFRPNLSLRFGANLGEGADWGIGLAWRTR